MAGGFLGSDGDHTFSRNTGLDDSRAETPDAVPAAGDTPGQEYTDVPRDGQTGDTTAVAAGTPATRDSTDERTTASTDDAAPPDDGATGTGDGPASNKELEQRIAQLEQKIDGLAGGDAAAAESSASVAAHHAADGTSGAQPDYSDIDTGPRAEDLDAEGMDRTEFMDTWTDMSNAERGKYLHSELQGDHPAKGLLKEMAGPAGGSIAGAVVASSAALSPVLGPAAPLVAGAATAGASGLIAYGMKQSTDRGVRGGLGRIGTAISDSGRSIKNTFKDQLTRYETTETSGPSGADASDNHHYFER